jgi:hypothetical protein
MIRSRPARREGEGRDDEATQYGPVAPDVAVTLLDAAHHHQRDVAQPPQLGEDLLQQGVAAKETDRCADYRPDDQSVWAGRRPMTNRYRRRSMPQRPKRLRGVSAAQHRAHRRQCAQCVFEGVLNAPDERRGSGVAKPPGYKLSIDCWLGGADDVADQVPYCACRRSAPADPDGLKLAVQVQLGDSDGAQPTDRQIVGDR